MAEIAANPQVRIFDPATSLCQGDVCRAVTEGRPTYRDDFHLTLSGAARLAPAMTDAVTWLTTP